MRKVSEASLPALVHENGNRTLDSDVNRRKVDSGGALQNNARLVHVQEVGPVAAARRPVGPVPLLNYSVPNERNVLVLAVLENADRRCCVRELE